MIESKLTWFLQLAHMKSMVQQNWKGIRCLHAAKSNEFYEEQNILRRYFYVIDSKGQVFQEATKHRNFVTCMKDIAFLNILHTLLRPNKTELFPEYPLYFPCGPEHNFVIPEDDKSVLGFSKMTVKENKLFLHFGSSNVSQEFDPSVLFCCSDTGRFYHTISSHKYLKGKLGLLHPQISESLSNNIKLSEDGEHFEYWDVDSGKRHKIQDVTSVER